MNGMKLGRSQGTLLLLGLCHVRKEASEQYHNIKSYTECVCPQYHLLSSSFSS